MEKIPNINLLNAEALLARVQPRFPNSKIRKPLFAPKTVFITKDNYKIFLQPKNEIIKMDFVPPALWTIGGFIALWLLANGILYFSKVRGLFIGALIPALISFYGAKAIFKSQKKAELDNTTEEIKSLINSTDSNSIFS